jgi:hypothetical protein
MISSNYQNKCFYKWYKLQHSLGDTKTAKFLKNIVHLKNNSTKQLMNIINIVTKEHTYYRLIIDTALLLFCKGKLFF